MRKARRVEPLRAPPARKRLPRNVPLRARPQWEHPGTAPADRLSQPPVGSTEPSPPCGSDFSRDAHTVRHGRATGPPRPASRPSRLKPLPQANPACRRVPRPPHRRSRPSATTAGAPSPCPHDPRPARGARGIHPRPGRQFAPAHTPRIWWQRPRAPTPCGSDQPQPPVGATSVATRTPCATVEPPAHRAPRVAAIAAEAAPTGEPGLPACSPTTSPALPSKRHQRRRPIAMSPRPWPGTQRTWDPSTPLSAVRPRAHATHLVAAPPGAAPLWQRPAPAPVGATSVATRTPCATVEPPAHRAPRVAAVAAEAAPTGEPGLPACSPTTSPALPSKRHHRRSPIHAPATLARHAARVGSIHAPVGSSPPRTRHASGGSAPGRRPPVAATKHQPLWERLQSRRAHRAPR